jgi:hypothetical protein
MHLPPAAQVRVGRSKSHFCFLVLWTAVYAGFLWTGFGSFAPSVLAGLALAFAVAWAYSAWRWWSGPAGLLAWTGRQWFWHRAQDKQICSVRWRMDLQSVVLLELHVQGRPSTCLWIERGALGAASWMAFRRALVGASEPWIAADDEKTDFSAANY